MQIVTGYRPQRYPRIAACEYPVEFVIVIFVVNRLLTEDMRYGAVGEAAVRDAAGAARRGVGAEVRGTLGERATLSGASVRLV
jgi:hypothetical protein